MIKGILWTNDATIKNQLDLTFIMNIYYLFAISLLVNNQISMSGPRVIMD